MAAFYYWIPMDRAPTNTSAVLRILTEAGLHYAFDERVTTRTSERGPDGMRGVVVVAGDNADGKLGWWPEEQTWKRIPRSEIWCGMFKEDVPTPDSLIRDDTISGEWLTLDDGRRWLIPCARRFKEHGEDIYPLENLPKRLTLNDDGEWVPGGIKSRYRKLWDLTCGYADAWSKALQDKAEGGTGVLQIPDETLLHTAVEAVKTNYRVGAIELDMLGVFDQEVMWKVLAVLIDEKTFHAWAKKKVREQADGGGTS